MYKKLITGNNDPSKYKKLTTLMKRNNVSLVNNTGFVSNANFGTKCKYS